MTPRDPREAHRASTPLELLFDLCFAVAVAQASSRLHHGLAEGICGHAVLAYALVFFAIWWAWMNFTWFASAYDADDVPYRLAVLVQIAGVLVIAAGIPRAFDRRDFAVVTLGYAIMRVGLVSLWLRAAHADGARRRTALRYAAGVTLCQLGWIGLLLLPPGQWLRGWMLLAPAELLVPLWAERVDPTPWHPHHIAERYGLLTLIVLGESVLSATVAIQSALDAGHLSGELAALVVGGLLVLFCLWWIYFDRPVHHLLVSNRVAFLWGYGHLVVFAATAAVGAGLGVAADALTGHAGIPALRAGLAVTLPVTLYVLAVWLLQVRPARRGVLVTAAFFLAPLLVLAASPSRDAVLISGIVLVGLVTLSEVAG
ncbi:MAG TPA: low temperature requirement protein A [Myxococcaceae bacterium]|nr:low temperature requirement protein A [Myxococcaceae bacterium]